MAGNRTLKLSLLADSKEFGKGLQQGETKLQRFGKGAAKVGKLAAGAGAAAGALGVAAFAAARKVADGADQIAKGAERLGVTTDTYQELDYWASQNGISSDSMARSVGRLNQRIGKAAAGSSKYAAAFADLGVELTDGNGKLRDTDAVLADTIGNLRAIEDPAARSAAAAEVFGTKMARDLMPALEDTGLSLADAAEQAHNLGAVIDGDTLEAGTRFGDSLDRIKRSAGGLFTDALTPLMTWLADTGMPIIETRVLPGLRRFGEIAGPWLSAKLGALQRFASGTIMPMLRTLTGVFRQRVLPVLRTVGAFIGDQLVPRFRTVADAVGRRVTPVLEIVTRVLSSAGRMIRAVVTPVLGALRDAFADVSAAMGSSGGGGAGSFIDTALRVLDAVTRLAAFVSRHVAPIIGTVLGGAIRTVGRLLATFVGTIRSALSFLSRLASRVRAVGNAIASSPIGKLAGSVAGGIGRLLGRAAGGSVTGGTPYLVGERGPELYVPSGSGRIVPASRTPAAGGTTINVTGAMLDPEGVARAVERAMRTAERRGGVLA